VVPTVSTVAVVIPHRSNFYLVCHWTENSKKNQLAGIPLLPKIQVKNQEESVQKLTVDIEFKFSEDLNDSYSKNKMTPSKSPKVKSGKKKPETVMEDITKILQYFSRLIQNWKKQKTRIVRPSYYSLVNLDYIALLDNPFDKI